MSRYVARVSTLAANVGAVKTILQLTAGAADRMQISEIGVSFDGTNASATPVTVQLVRQTSAGTGGGSAITPVAMNPADGAAHTTAVSGPAGAWTTEPTAGDVLREWRVPPSSGLVLQFPLDFQPTVGLNGIIALTVNAAAAVDVTAYMEWTE
jgi:hypothetical protein